MDLDAYTLVRTLGEGGQGEVRLAVHKHTKVHVAVKFNTKPKTAEKEARIHGMLSNKNVLKFFGTASYQNRACILLEFAPGGSLADIIEPYRGLGNSEACHKYFKQLLAGTEYLHDQGVVHRDIKPDNLLIDSDDNLKISDFGLASVFRRHGTEQQQGQWCGTLSYMAPEIYTNQPYQAQPVDVWSCGIVLVYLLTGGVPWDEPKVTNEHPDKYAAWIEGFIYFSPWDQVDEAFLPLLQEILVENPAKRATIKAIKEHQWLSKPYVKPKKRSSRECEDLKIRPMEVFLLGVFLFVYILYLNFFK